MEADTETERQAPPLRVPALRQRLKGWAPTVWASGPALLPDALLVGLLLLVLILPALRWIPEGATVPEGDSATHLLNALYFQERLLGARSLADVFVPFLTSCDINTYPPVVYEVTGLLGAWSGGLDLAGLLSLNIGWVALAVVSLYVLARRLFGGTRQEPRLGQGRLVGFAAALLLAFSPFLLSQVSVFLLDLPAMGMLTLALAALACGMDLESPLQALFAGVAVGLALLTKWTTLFGLAPGLVFVVVQVYRRCDREDRAALRRLLGVALVMLAAAIGLALVHPPGHNQDLQSLDAGDVHRWLAGVVAGSLVLLVLARRWLRSAPARNLVLAGCVAMALASTFYLTHFSVLLHKLLVDLPESGQRAAQESDARQASSPLQHLFFQAWGVPLSPLVVSGLLWLWLRGPRGGLALLGFPMLVHILAHMVFCYFGGRYYLPSFPLEILVACGWLLTSRETRAVTLGLVLGLGLWNAAPWLDARTPYRNAFEAREGLEWNRGCGPESANGRLAQMTDRISEIAGPGGPVVGVVSWCETVQPISVAAIGASRGHILLVQDLRRAGGALSLRYPAICYDPRLVALRLPELAEAHLVRQAAAPVHMHGEAWVLTLGQAPSRFSFPSELDGRLGPGQALPAPAGCPATLYPVLPPVAPGE